MINGVQNIHFDLCLKKMAANLPDRHSNER